MDTVTFLKSKANELCTELGDMNQLQGRSKFKKADWQRKVKELQEQLEARDARKAVCRKEEVKWGAKDFVSIHIHMILPMLVPFLIPFSHSGNEQEVRLATLYQSKSLRRLVVWNRISKLWHGAVFSTLNWHMFRTWWSPKIGTIESEWDLPHMFAEPWNEIRFWFREFRQLFANRRAYKSTVRETFTLTASQWRELSPSLEEYAEAVINPHYRSGPCSTVYPRNLLAELGILLYVTTRDFEDLKTKKSKLLAKKRKQREEARETAQKKRKKRLVTQLEKKGLMLRADSKLCEQYIASGRPSVDTVVTTMVEMDFFFKHTDYEEIREKLYDQEREERDNEWEEWRQNGCDRDFRPESSPIDAQELSETAKKQALQKFCKSDKYDPSLIPNSLQQ